MSILPKMTKVAAIDFETANGSPASICSVGISVLEDGCPEEVYESLIRPEKNVRWFSRMNIRVHGIQSQDVEDAPDFAQVYKEIVPLLEDSVVAAHNARFDMGCLKASCLNCGLPVPRVSYFDTVELSRRVFPNLAHHRLNDVCDYLHVELDHHKAGSDAYGCLMIVANIMNLAGIYDINELLEQCSTRIYHL